MNFCLTQYVYSYLQFYAESGILCINRNIVYLEVLSKSYQIKSMHLGTIQKTDILVGTVGIQGSHSVVTGPWNKKLYSAVTYMQCSL